MHISYSTPTKIYPMYQKLSINSVSSKTLICIHVTRITSADKFYRKKKKNFLDSAQIASKYELAEKSQIIHNLHITCMVGAYSRQYLQAIDYIIL